MAKVGGGSSTSSSMDDGENEGRGMGLLMKMTHMGLSNNRSQRNHQRLLVSPARTEGEEEAEVKSNEMIVQIDTIDVACGKERMTVRITFDDRFNGIIYAKVSEVK